MRTCNLPGCEHSNFIFFRVRMGDSIYIITNRMELLISGKPQCPATNTIILPLHLQLPSYHRYLYHHFSHHHHHHHHLEEKHPLNPILSNNEHLVKHATSFPLYSCLITPINRWTYRGWEILGGRCFSIGNLRKKKQCTGGEEGCFLNSLIFLTVLSLKGKFVFLVIGKNGKTVVYESHDILLNQQVESKLRAYSFAGTLLAY